MYYNFNLSEPPYFSELEDIVFLFSPMLFNEKVNHDRKYFTQMSKISRRSHGLISHNKYFTMQNINSTNSAFNQLNIQL